MTLRTDRQRLIHDRKDRKWFGPGKEDSDNYTAKLGKVEQKVSTTRKSMKVKASWEQVKLAVVMVSSFCSQAKLWEND